MSIATQYMPDCVMKRGASARAKQCETSYLPLSLDDRAEQLGRPTDSSTQSNMVIHATQDGNHATL